MTHFRKIGLFIFVIALDAIGGPLSDRRPFFAPDVRLSPGGIIYPRFTQAAWMNPATLNATKAVSAQTLLGFRTNPEDPYVGSIATAFSNFDVGVGGGYISRLFDAGTLHSAFGGMGIALNRLSFGAGAYWTDFSQETTPRISLGTLYQARHKVDYGVVAYDLQSSTPTIAFGIGIGNTRTYRLEANVIAPVSIDHSIVSKFLLSGEIVYNRLTLSVTEVLQLNRSGTQTFTHSASIGAWLNKSIHISAQFNSPQQFYATLTIGSYLKRHSHTQRKFQHLLGRE